MLGCEFPWYPLPLQNWVSGVQISDLLLWPPSYLDIPCQRPPLLISQTPNAAERSQGSKCTGLRFPEPESWKELDLRSTAGFSSRHCPREAVWSSSLLCLLDFPDLVVKVRVQVAFCSAGPAWPRERAVSFRGKEKGAHLAEQAPRCWRQLLWVAGTGGQRRPSCCSERIQVSAWELLVSGLASLASSGSACLLLKTERVEPMREWSWPQAASSSMNDEVESETCWASEAARTFPGSRRGKWWVRTGQFSICSEDQKKGGGAGCSYIQRDHRRKPNGLFFFSLILFYF